jgi:NIMA (never in mitosis gene a)-related kinase
MSEDEGKKGFGFGGKKSPVKTKSARAPSPARWDPDEELEMPSPFLVRSRKMVK